MAGAESVPRVHALVVAAGKGERMGGEIPKQYLDLGGRPVLIHAIEAVSRDARVASVTVVLAPDDRQFESIEKTLETRVDRVTGGASRAESVLNGLRAIARRAPRDWILVHDAVRPCLPGGDLKRLLDVGLASKHGALLAAPVRDTLKREAPGPVSLETVPRAGLWAAQTPQLFPLDDLLQSLSACLEAGENPTDEAAAMERGDRHPLLVQGAAINIKITYPEDVEMAKAWLARQGEGG